MAKISHLIIEQEGLGWAQVKGLKKRLQTATELTLASLPENLIPTARAAQVTVLLTTDRRVQSLNRDYRGIDKPTNVLSFPQYESKDLIKVGRKVVGGLYVGDIAVAYQYVVREAKADGKQLLDHVTHLVIHGLLHLFGYDHDTDRRASRMEKMEKEIMASMGLLDPYAPIDESYMQRRSAKRTK